MSVVDRFADLRERLTRDVQIDGGRLPAYVFADDEVYELELATIFARSWLCVGHISEIPQPGDYVTRRMGISPVIVVRSEDGIVRVFLNVCRHRGMRVCRADLGNSSHFRCPYHGFTYKNTGELIGVPFQQQAYGDSLDRDSIKLNEARVDQYAGLIFATWDSAAPSLADYLGDMRWYLDLFVGRSEMEVFGPPHRWEVACNWKIPAENFASDAYHTGHLHASAAKLGLVASAKYAESGYHVHAGHGHGVGLGLPSENSIFPPEILEAADSHLSNDQAAIFRQLKNLHGTVFPNVSFLISSGILHGRLVSHTHMRLWTPVAAGRTEVVSTGLIDKHASQEWKERSRQHYVFTFGPSGIFEQDDSETFVDITRNCATPAAKDFQFIYQQGLGRPLAVDFPGPGEAYQSKYSENNARCFYRQWLEQVCLDG